ncbi:hypothetical protein NM688_g6141 [Phlebia brevispora]|uniref:Uncharacterized protein n=1 Tax=Phlebia brevispora TaxID=194682 RepID=A0ACC1SJ99_9APHY|nr:hypothetical protein NM688_g6141 [Phlebia brevispora]
MTFAEQSRKGKDVQAVSAPHRHIQNLRLTGLKFGMMRLYYPSVVEWLESTPAHHTLEEVDFNPVEQEDVPAAVRYLAALGPNLKRLRLGLKADIDTYPGLINGLHLRRYTGLTSLYINVSDITTQGMRWIGTLLQDWNACPLLEQVVFEMTPFTGAHILRNERDSTKVDPWNMIDSFLRYHLRGQTATGPGEQSVVPLKKVVFLFTMTPEGCTFELAEAVLRTRLGHLDQMYGRQVLFVKDATEFTEMDIAVCKARLHAPFTGTPRSEEHLNASAASHQAPVSERFCVRRVKFGYAILKTFDIGRDDDKNGFNKMVVEARKGMDGGWSGRMTMDNALQDPVATLGICGYDGSHPPGTPCPVLVCPCAALLLYSKGRILGHKRAKRNSRPNTTLIQIEGVATKEDAQFYLGKRVAYIYRAKRKIEGSNVRVIWGRVTRLHGNSGVVKSKFASNIPPHAFGASVRVMLYPSRI